MIKELIREYVEYLEQELSKKYEYVFDVWGQHCYKAREDEYFRISGFSYFHAVMIEHALSEEEARKSMFEDGDRFFVEEMSKEEILKAVIHEIEN